VGFRRLNERRRLSGGQDRSGERQHSAALGYLIDVIGSNRGGPRCQGAAPRGAEPEDTAALLTAAGHRDAEHVPTVEVGSGRFHRRSRSGSTCDRSQSAVVDEHVRPVLQEVTLVSRSFSTRRRLPDVLRRATGFLRQLNAADDVGLLANLSNRTMVAVHNS